MIRVRIGRGHGMRKVVEQESKQCCVQFSRQRGPTCQSGTAFTQLGVAPVPGDLDLRRVSPEEAHVRVLYISPRRLLHGDTGARPHLMPRQTSNQAPRVRRSLHPLQLMLELLGQAWISRGGRIEQVLYRLLSALHPGLYRRSRNEWAGICQAHMRDLRQVVLLQNRKRHGAGCYARVIQVAEILHDDRGSLRR